MLNITKRIKINIQYDNDKFRIYFGDNPNPIWIHKHDTYKDVYYCLIYSQLTIRQQNKLEEIEHSK